MHRASLKANSCFQCLCWLVCHPIPSTNGKNTVEFSFRHIISSCLHNAFPCILGGSFILRQGNCNRFYIKGMRLSIANVLGLLNTCMFVNSTHPYISVGFVPALDNCSTSQTVKQKNLVSFTLLKSQFILIYQEIKPDFMLHTEPVA